MVPSDQQQQQAPKREYLSTNSSILGRALPLFSLPSSRSVDRYDVRSMCSSSHDND
jgi:hypothetical protein